MVVDRNGNEPVEGCKLQSIKFGKDSTKILCHRVTENEVWLKTGDHGSPWRMAADSFALSYWVVVESP